MADLDLLINSDDYSDYKTKINAGLTKENTIYNGLDGGAAGDVPRKVNSTDFNYEFIRVPTLKTGEVPREKMRLATNFWSMDTTASLTVPHGLNSTQWKTITVLAVMIRNDADDKLYRLDRKTSSSTGITSGGVSEINSSSIVINRTDSGFFASGAFSSGSPNRGYIDIEYTP